MVPVMKFREVEKVMTASDMFGIRIEMAGWFALLCIDVTRQPALHSVRNCSLQLTVHICEPLQIRRLPVRCIVIVKCDVTSIWVKVSASASIHVAPLTAKKAANRFGTIEQFI